MELVSSGFDRLLREVSATGELSTAVAALAEAVDEVVSAPEPAGPTTRD
jgi:hypothetical protein